MDVHKVGSGVFKAIQYFKDAIASGVWDVGRKLPGTRVLARQIQVNNHTLSAAMKILSAENVITAIPGKGTFVGKPPTAQLMEKESETLMVRVYGKLQHSLLSGAFDFGVLPPLSVLADRYGVCFKTMRTLCRRLEDEGLITRQSGRFRIVTRNTLGASPASAVLSISFAHDKTISIYNEFIRNGIASLELSCMRSNLSLIKIGSDSVNNGKAVYDHLSSDNCFGYILWSPLSADDSRLFADLVNRVTAFDKPVAVIDEWGSYVLPETLSEVAKNRIRVFSPAGVLAGKMVGRHLVECGHKKCLYISCWHDQAWSKSRLKGLVDSFGKNIENAVTPYVCNTVGSEEFPPVAEQRAFVDFARKEFLRLFPTALFWASTQIHSVLSGIETAEYLTKQKLWNGLFEQAIQDKSATAWVCADDSLAALAAEFLQKTQSRQVRDSIELIGFDDQPIATEYNITSYNFAPATLIDKAVGFLVYPRQEFFKGKTRIECEGILIERGSAKPNTIT